MQIRLIQSKDNQAIKHILQADLKAAGLDIPGTAYFDDNLDYLSEYYHQKNYRDYFVVVNDDGKVVGGAGFAEFDLTDKIAELQKLYLDESATGFGLSYQLISLIEQKAKQAGYNQLYLETHHNLSAAIHVYTKADFQKLDGPLKTSHHSGAMDGFYIKNI